MSIRWKLNVVQLILVDKIDHGSGYQILANMLAKPFLQHQHNVRVAQYGITVERRLTSNTHGLPEEKPNLGARNLQGRQWEAMMIK